MSTAGHQDTAVNKWVVAVTVMFGAFVAVMDISVVNVSLPHMMGSFGQDQSAITWVATAYSIAEIIMVSMSGWWSQLIGRKRLYMISFGVFTLGSILCGTAHTFTLMITYRVLQGIGGGALIPVSQAILREAFPAEEQGIAMAMYGMGVVLAPAFGPIIGGWLTDHYGWPWIFYVNVPFCLLGMLLVWIFVHDPHYLLRGVKRIDFVGIALLTVCLTLLQVVLERGQEYNWFESAAITWGSVATVLTFVAFVAWELRVDDPVVELRILRNTPLLVGSLFGLVFGVALFGTTFVLPQFTQELLGYPAFQAGLVLAPRAVALLVCMPIAGWLYRYVDGRILILFGICFVYWAYYDLAHLAIQSSFASLVPILVVMGIGMPFMFVTMSTMSLSTIPRESMTSASSLYTLFRRVGGNLGYALVATLVARGRQTHRVQLVSNVTASGANYQQYHHHVATTLQHAGLAAGSAEQAALGFTNHLIDRQATMLAYNDVSWVMGLLFLLTVPLLFFFPQRATVD